MELTGKKMGIHWIWPYWSGSRKTGKSLGMQVLAYDAHQNESGKEIGTSM